MRNRDQYRMGHTRKHVFPAPSKIAFETHNGRTIVANPSGVPAKWLPIYRELAASMYAGGCSFAIGKDEKEPGNPVTLRLEEEPGVWITYKDPAHVARTLGIGAPARTPKVERKPAPTRHKRGATTFTVPTDIAPPAGSVPVESDLPTWAEEWLSGLVYAPKAQYAREYLEHILLGAPEPKSVQAEWAEKARKRADRLAERAA